MPSHKLIFTRLNSMKQRVELFHVQFRFNSNNSDELLSQFHSSHKCMRGKENAKHDCWNCGSKMHKNNIFCAAPKCGVVQSLEKEKINLFELFSLPQSFSVDLSKLDHNFKLLQKQLHPDMFATKSNDEKAVSNSSSGVINYGYRTLKFPISRAEYLILLLFKKNVFEENNSNQDMDLLKEMFEYRMKIEEADDKNSRILLRKELQEKFDQLEYDISKYFASKDELNSISTVLKMKYFHKMIEDLDIDEDH